MLVIQVHAQANPWANGEKGSCFSVQWSVGRSTSEDLPANILLKDHVLPWNWQSAKIAVLIQKAGKWSALSEHDLTKDESIPTVVKHRLRLFEDLCKQNPQSYVIPTTNEPWRPTRNDRLGNPVAAQGELAHLPQPIPERLRLGGRIFLSEPQLKDVERVALLPVFTASNNGRMADFSTMEQVSGTDFFKVQYQSVKDQPTYQAHLLTVSPAKSEKVSVRVGEPPEGVQVYQKFGDYRERLAQILDIPRLMQSAGILEKLEANGLREYLGLTEEHFAREFSFLKLKDSPELKLPSDDAIESLRTRLQTSFDLELLNQLYLETRRTFVLNLKDLEDGQEASLTAYLNRWTWKDAPISTLWVQARVVGFLRGSGKADLSIAEQDCGPLVLGAEGETMASRIQEQLESLRAGGATSPWYPAPVGLTSLFKLNSGSRNQNIQWIFFLREAEQEKKPWRCLNLVKIDGLNEELVAPYRVPRSEEETLLNYRNQPYHSSFRASQVQNTNTQMVYQNAYGLERKLTRLSFGLKYQTAALPVGHGCLTAEVAKSAVSLAPDEEIKIDVTEPTLTYRRDVKVGAPRLQDLTVEQFPNTVHPLARSLPSLAVERERKAPLLLLREANASAKVLEFQVLPPSCDPTTWEHCLRLVEQDPKKPWELEKAKFAGQLTRFLTALSSRNGKGQQSTQVLKTDDVPFDPFVEDIELTVVIHRPGNSVVSKAGVRLSSQSLKLTPRLTSREWSLTALDSSAGGQQLATLQPGTVTQLVFTPLVHPETYGRFVGPINEDRPWEKDEDLKQPKQEDLRVEAAQTQILIEVPSRDMPSPEDLLNALQIELTSDRKLSVGVRASLELEPERKSNFDLGCSYELFIQRWLWAGRPVNAGSMRALNLDDGQALDNHLFREREDNDALPEPRHIDFASMWNDERESVLVPMKSMDLSGEFDSQLYRFGLRVRSRYEGWLDKLDPVDSRRVVDGRMEEWEPFLVRSRFAGTLPAPRPQLIVPLTDADSHSAVTPLLVVMRETWFGLGGLGEVLDCRVAQIRNPNDKSMVNQMGPDPILKSSANLRSDPVDLEVEGPLGHTFDSEVTLNPLYRRASFILHPPEGSNPWDFLQVQFRRALMAQSREQSADDLESSWTRPIWTQLLPAANELGVVLEDLTHEDEILRHSIPPEPPEGFEWWLLVTLLKSDAHGNRNVEVFSQMAPVDDGVPLSEDAGTIVARILEIQNISQDLRDVQVTDIWDRLFPPETELPVEPQSRIVRMSPPTRLNLKKGGGLTLG